MSVKLISVVKNTSEMGNYGVSEKATLGPPIGEAGFVIGIVSSAIARGMQNFSTRVGHM
jgi:hypothetical protein